MVAGTIETVVEKVVAGGDGLAHLPDGRVLFVPFSLPGERLKVRVTQEKKDYAVGRIEDIIKASPDRIEPRCSHYGKCGGCQLQHLSYEGELQIKKAVLNEILARQAKVDVEPEAIYPSPEEWGYRSKSEHPLAPHKPEPLLGYFQRRTHRVVDIHQCPVLYPASLDDLCKLRTLLGKTGEPIYDGRTGLGNLRYIVLRRSSNGERLIGLVTYNDELAGQTIAALMKGCSDLAGIVQNVNPHPGNRILGERNQVISGADHLTEEIDGLELRVSFPSFFQANCDQAERIVAVVREFLQPQPDEVLCDAYAGVGMIGLALASNVKALKAIEASPAAVADGKRNAEQNGFANVTWLEGEAGNLLGELAYDLLVLDPPRRGLTDDVIAAVLKTKPRRVCYVSCNPATWARDIQPFIEADYSLKRLAMIDMFPRTAHLEIVSLLEAV